jgi:hypothetical protein
MMVGGVVVSDLVGLALAPRPKLPVLGWAFTSDNQLACECAGRVSTREKGQALSPHAL